MHQPSSVEWPRLVRLDSLGRCSERPNGGYGCPSSQQRAPLQARRRLSTPERASSFFRVDVPPHSRRAQLPEAETVVLQPRDHLASSPHLALSDVLLLDDLLETPCETPYAVEEDGKLLLCLDARSVSTRGVARGEKGVSLGEVGADRAREGLEGGVLGEKGWRGKGCRCGWEGGGQGSCRSA